MGMMIEGVWTSDLVDARKTGGRFDRAESRFRSWVTADGAAGPSGEGGFAAEAGRYHLYVSHACPWAHRTMIVRALKGLESAITVSVVDPLMLEHGWAFNGNRGCIPDVVNGKKFMWEIYKLAEPGYTGRISVPVLWDKKRRTIVNNESSEIIRMFNAAFHGVGATNLDLYPKALRAPIDEVNALVYDRINNGVYKCGFATAQDAYEEAFDALFAALDRIEALLARQRYVAGDVVTEADWRLFTTLIRFDAVYHGHFKCNLRKLIEYPNLWSYTRELYQVAKVAATVDMDHILRHYYTSQTNVNPSQVVAKGPVLDFAQPHDRGRIPARAA